MHVYDNKPRRRGFRYIMVGLRYHQGENLSLVTIGFSRGSMVDCRTLKKKIFTWIKREFGKKFEYVDVEVWENTESTDADTRWRVHIHMIWNAPYIAQGALLEKIEMYIGDSAHVYISLLDGDNKRAARYLMQYLGNQKGLVYFNKSRGWLPAGYNRFWKDLIADFRVNQSRQQSLTEKGHFIKITQCSDVWWTALLEGCDEWIDEQRQKARHNPSTQMVL